MPNPRILQLSTARRVLSQFIPTYFDVLGREFDRCWTDIKAGFPNPVIMVFAALGFFTSIPFLPLYAFVENFGRSMLPNARYYRRFVITGEDAFKLCTEITTRTSFKAGLIDTTFLEELIVWVAVRIWNAISGGGWIGRLRRLIGLQSYDDVFRMVKSALTRNIAMQVLRWALVWFGVGYAMITMLVLGVYWNDWFTHLQQNNPRTFGVQRNRVRKK